MVRVSRPAIVTLLALLGNSCHAQNPVGPTSLTSTDRFISALQQQGAIVRRGDALGQALPCWSASAEVVFVNSGAVNVFEYSNRAAAERDAARVSSDGSSISGNGCAAKVSWVAPPHFYKRDQLIVVYAGQANDVLEPLEVVMSKPFVG